MISGLITYALTCGGTDAELHDKEVSLTTSQITGSQTAIFEYDPQNEPVSGTPPGPWDGYSLFTIDLSGVKDDIEDLRQQLADMQECCEDVAEILGAEPEQGETCCDAVKRKAQEVVDENEDLQEEVDDLQEQLDDCHECWDEVVAALQQYDPDYDPQSGECPAPEIDKVVEEKEGYEFPVGVVVPDEVVTDLNTKLDDLDMPDTSMNYYAKVVLREQASGTEIYQYKPLTAQLFTSEYTQYYSANVVYTVNINGIEADIVNTGFNLKSNNWRAEIDTWDRTTGTFTITVYISDPNYNPDVWHYWGTYTRTFPTIAGYGSADHTNKDTNRT